jgi:hypothetical protein
MGEASRFARFKTVQTETVRLHHSAFVSVWAQVSAYGDLPLPRGSQFQCGGCFVGQTCRTGSPSRPRSEAGWLTASSQVPFACFRIKNKLVYHLARR